MRHNKNLKIKLMILLLVLSFSCKAQQIQEPNLSGNIIGTWISNEDPLLKVTYTTNGERKDLYENLLSDTYKYSITDSCNGQKLAENYHIFLRLTNLLGSDVTCNFINGIHTDSNGIVTLSITSERGKLYLFTKQ
jgi:hypothetical protein